MKKILSISLAIVIMFSSIPFSASAQGTNTVAPLTITDVFYSIKNVFDNVLGFLGGDKKVDVEKHTGMACEVPGLDDGFIPQGICYVEELEVFAISGYMPDDKDGNKQYSRIYLVNPETKESKMFIIDNFTGHAGGIASNGNDIWVSSGGSSSSNGKVYHFTTDMFTGESGSSVKHDGYFSVPVKGSVLYCDGEKLWVCEFYNNDKDSNKVNKDHHEGTNHAWACGYKLPLDVDYSVKETKIPDVILSIPDKVQGMSITADGNVIFSTSYGRKNDSRMYVFEPYTEWKCTTVSVFGENANMYISKKRNRIIRFKMPTLMEGIDYHDGKLYIIFESGAKTYADAKEINKDIWEMDIDKIV
ncbi:MAG: hypothetical protein IKV25_01980 [Clostridia bacterium]|nr:hypothetical protein [Clostridia bacterium]